MSAPDPLDQLGRAHGFSRDELRANQAGALHPAQRARGLRQGRGAIVTCAALGVLALAGGLGGAWLFRDSLGDAPSATDLNAVKAIAAAGVGLALAFFVAAFRSRAQQRARRAAFAQGTLDVVEGPMHKTHIRGRGGVPDSYRFQVGPRAFDTRQAGWELLTQGAAYRLYCVHDQLLSLEPVLDDPHERAEYAREVEQFERTRHIRPSGLVE